MVVDLLETQRLMRIPRLQPGIPIERGHAFRSKAATYTDAAAIHPAREVSMRLPILSLFLIAAKCGRLSVE
jgi:hypothetical protein